MHVGRGNPNYDYTMNNEVLQISDNEKDIGFNINKSLKPSTHCNIVAKKANTVLSLISRNFHFRDKFTFVNLYCQHVRPILEYASPVWSPWLECDKKVVEGVQKRMVKMISGLYGSTYEERLVEIGLHSLEYRREKADMVQVFKMIKGIDNVDYKNWFQTYGDLSGDNRPSTRLSNDPLNIIQQRCSGDLRKNFFSVRVVPKWNSLPTEVKNSRSVAIFKLNYDRLQQLD
jgi:ribonucleases P/MRP protein subunit RPP40